MTIAKVRNLSDIRFAAIHNSAVLGVPSGEEQLHRKLASHEIWHSKKGYPTSKGELGFTHLLYHYAIAGDGFVIQTQDAKYERWHATDNYKGSESANRFGIAILLEGNFEKELPTSAQLAAAARIIRDWNATHNIKLIVKAHREFAAPRFGTACAGINMGLSTQPNSRLSQIIDMVETGSTTPPPQTPINQIATITATVLNVRTGPSTEFPIIGKLRFGQVVPVVSKSGKWLRIDFQGEQAWVHGDYVKLSAIAPPPPPQDDPDTISRLDELATWREAIEVRRSQIHNEVRLDEMNRIDNFIRQRKDELA